MKKTFLFLFSSFLTFFTYSLPGFKPYINDISGEYVYYQDKSFKRESYVGFLTYDESTYQARYFAPQDSNGSLPQKDIQILFTLNPDEDHVNLTGERIITPINQEDTEIVNYLHDMVYELTARRIKQTNVMPCEEYISSKSFNENGIISWQDFPQFGGEVSILFDYLVPLFNIKSIRDNKNNEQLVLLTAGRIQSTQDTSFTDFSGFKEADKKSKLKFKPSKNAKPAKYETSCGQKIILDATWSQQMENLWTCGDSALISAGFISKSTQTEENKAQITPFILRQLLLSTSNSYNQWNKISYQIKNETEITVNSIYYQNETAALTKNIKNLSLDKTSGGYYFFTISIFNDIYTKNKKYFDSIIKSYSTN